MVMSSTLVKPRAILAGLISLGVLIALVSLGPIASAGAATTSVPGLPDGRGYEKVSPNNNADGNVYQAWPSSYAPNGGGFTELPYEAASDGNALAYVGMPSEEGGTGREGGNGGNEYLARRRADGGWEAENVTPPSDVFATVPVYQGFSPDLSHGFLTTNANIPLDPGAPAAGYRIPYVRDFETGAYESLLSALPPNRGKFQFGAYEIAKLGANGSQPAFASSSADISHVLFMANDALTTNAVDEGAEDNNLYDYHDGSLTLVNVLPDGSPEPSAVYGGPSTPPDEPEVNGPDFSHVISEDGTRIFWTGQGANRNIYMREDDSRTVQVDASVGGGGQYWTATPDGSKALFTKGGDLYEYDVESGQTTDLTPGGEVQGVVGASDDFSYVYLVADAVLAPGGKQGGGCSAPYQAGECGLYVLHAGEPARFIAMLSVNDNFEYNARSYFGDWQGGLADRQAEVTPDGRQLLFYSTRSLTGYDNGFGGLKDEELFVYEFESAKLHCISCNPSGEPPTSFYSAFLPVSNQNTGSLQWMSDDGSRVFFNSLDPLVPQDTNGLNDVYEWERDGSGGCTSSEGCIYLLSGGAGGEGSFLVDSSVSGDDAFLTTRAQLVAEDQNENIDVYDAHVGAKAPPAQPQCTGTGCQGLPSAPPVFATPSSVTYEGVGNFASAPTVATKAKKAHAKKARTKNKKKRRRVKKSRKTKRSIVGRPDKGHVSSAHVTAANYGRSK